MLNTYHTNGPVLAGNMYLQHHDLPRAQDSLEEALKVFNHTLGSAHPETASIHYNMALVFEQLHNTGKARDHVRACVDIRQKTLGWSWLSL